MGGRSPERRKTRVRRVPRRESRPPEVERPHVGAPQLAARTVVRADVSGLERARTLMDTRVFLIEARHLMAAVVFGGLIFGGYKWIRSRSTIIGAVVALAILGRAALGLALFWISYLQLPILASLQMGGG